MTGSRAGEPAPSGTTDPAGRAGRAGSVPEPVPGRSAVAEMAFHLHALGLRDGSCTTADGGTDHEPSEHLAEARYVLGYPPVADPGAMADGPSWDRGEQLVELRRRYREGRL